MEKLTDPDRLSELIHANAREVQKPSLEQISDWLSNTSNLALVDGNDLGMFEAKGDWPGPLHAHVFFQSRGKQALITARQMLDQAFAYGATEILGTTPAKFRDAIVFARLLGFKKVGEIDHPLGKAVLSRLQTNN